MTRVLAYTAEATAMSRASIHVMGRLGAGSFLPPSHGVPAFIPTDQVYYWTHRWQESERRARDDLANGRYREFENPDDAVRHLLSGDR